MLFYIPKKMKDFIAIIHDSWVASIKVLKRAGDVTYKIWYASSEL